MDTKIEGLNLDVEKVAIEKEKLLLERDKMKLETHKVWLTGASIFIPLLIAAISFSISFYTSAQQAKLQTQLQAKQAENQLAMQERQAKDQFELKAAEIAMNARTPLEAKTKAKALANLFPDRLPSNFAESFDPNLYSMQVAKTKPLNQRRSNNPGWMQGQRSRKPVERNQKKKR
jgi:hypothetical protein